MRKIIVGVMGPGDAAVESDLKIAYRLGELIAQQGWVLLTGGRNVGVMDAASRGAKQAGGLTLGILPTAHYGGISAAVDIPILTGMGSARNNINILTSNIIIACGTGTGTVSEIALALKAGKQVILLNLDESSRSFFQRLSDSQIWMAETPEIAIEIAQAALSGREPS